MNFKQDSLIQYFPKPPYPIQLQIAKSIFTALRQQNQKLIVIQSPTGTGKTYSLLCPIIAWLSTHQIQGLKDQGEHKSKVPVWLKKVQEQKGQKLLREKQKAIDQMLSIDQAKEKLKNKRKVVIQKKKEETKGDILQEDLQVESQEQNPFKLNLKRQVDKQHLQVQNQLKLQSKAVLPRLIFISRTHSQLSQVISSLKQILKDRKDLTYLQLASKQQLCINKQINQHKPTINQRCQHLLDHSHCQFFHKLSIKEFYNNSLEALLQLGLDNNLCPYYSSRMLVEHADILCAPYTSILNEDIRNKLGINVNNAILVFDEGHNVVDVDKGMKSKEVTLDDIELLAKKVDEYLKKYRERLRVKNQRLMCQLLEILRSFIIVAQEFRKEQKDLKDHCYIKVKYIDFLLKMGLKDIRIQKITKYFQLNNIDKKLAYFNSNNLSNKQSHTTITPSTINSILSFILSFVSFKQHCQVLLLKWSESKRGVIKILCLQSDQLQKLIDKSRMTIIAGGTMQPLDELVAISSKWKHQTLIEKYPHIVKEDQCTIKIIRQYNNEDILFNHQTSSQQQPHLHYRPICTAIIRRIIEKTQKGGGIVIFIQNYQLLTMFQQIFKGEPYEQWILYDRRDKNEKEAEDLFTKYKKIVDSSPNHNPILVSVMGGKLSQGINFSDRLARALVVFGLPYSNIQAPEIIETMAYLDSKKHSGYTGKAYYQNLCLKTLNQTIGRGIRHINDYVDIYLVDSRFQGIRNKLSSWMRPRITVVKNIDEL